MKRNLGAIKKNDGVEFSVYSCLAQKIELCLFSADEKTEQRIELHKNWDNIWSVELPHIKAGQKYGYRAYGEFAPSKGLYFNPNKLLIDPFAKELSASINDWENPALSLTNNLDSTDVIPKSVVIFDDWQSDEEKYPYLHKKPHTPWEKTIIYEANVKGFSALHPDLPDDIKGTFRALSHPEIIQYLKALGVTHLELMPVTTTCGGLQLKKDLGLSDYWGYNPVNHFALDKRYGTRDDFKFMINELHKAGIEVGLDVVYNHSGEFGAKHNLISYKGLDAPSYYRLTENGELINTTGCDNSINTNSDIGNKIIKDSLEYFATDLGIDGFRFDLAGDCALNENQQFDANGRFMLTLRSIAEKYNVKISGEPWSAVGGYFRGHMDGLMEWNDKHEETIRRFYRGDENVVPELAGHISGGEGLYYGQNKSKYIRYVAVHDGFTAFDAVSYNEKNNWANNENNNDGSNNNTSSASPNEEIAFRRLKSMMVANILSRGVPLICAGDELARTQRGNNNAYCQDNELSWLNWRNFSDKQRELYILIRKTTALRLAHQSFSNLDVFTGQIVPSNGRKDIEWIRSDGNEMQLSDWHNAQNHILACVINGCSGEISADKLAQKQSDDDFMILMCGNTYGVVNFKLPMAPNGEKWSLVFDTAGKNKKINDDNSYDLEAYSYVLLTAKRNLEKQKQLLNVLPNKRNRHEY